MEMGLVHAGLLLQLLCSAFSYQFRSQAGFRPVVQDPEAEWERMKTMGAEEKDPAPRLWKSDSGSGAPTADASTFPEFIYVLKSKYPDAFKPEKGARPLPEWSGKILRVPKVATSTSGGTTTTTTSNATAGATRPKLVEALCHVDRVYVRIRREVFKRIRAFKYLTLGTCPVNQGTTIHYYLLYSLKSNCGFKLESKDDNLFISIVLYYKPTGQVLRQLPFSIPIKCKYPRFFQSYKVGFHPKLKGGTVFKALQPKQNVILTALDASGNVLTNSKTFTLGQPMFFEAKIANATTNSEDRRMYINKCFMTANQNSNSNPKYTVIDNQGCMVDGKVSRQSKFISGSSKIALKFSVAAFIFKDAVSDSTKLQQLYMHCDVSLGKLAPSPSSKACNYDPATQKWKELYGDDSVCTCCDSSCPSPLPKASRKTISSQAWKVNLNDEDGFVDVEPIMKSFAADSIGVEDPDMVENNDFVNYWEDDY